MEVQPLKTLTELQNWNSDGIGPLSTNPLINLCPNMDKSMTLVCHDMKGGYLDDRFTNGIICGTEQYWLWQWWQMDIFVYFSHNLVTIPPIGWINVAHKHGVRVLGAEICGEILKDEASVNQAALKLAQIAKTYNFDGWLINIENTIPFEYLDNLKRFVQIVTSACKDLLGGTSLVIWYDSVISTSGRLKWQDELNPLNKPFLDCCDGIFLNYCWTEASLKASKQFIGEGSHKVFIGVDVFGRGCMGGGGYNCNVPLRLINKYSFSSAIFGPGWVYETKETEDFQRVSNKFWGLISEYTSDRCINRLPIDTSFVTACQPTRDGKMLYNLSGQDIMPNIRMREAEHIAQVPLHPPPNDVIAFTYNTEMPGIQIKIREDATRIRLLPLDIPLPIPVTISLQFSASQQIDVGMIVTTQEGEFPPKTTLYCQFTPVNMKPCNVQESRIQCHGLNVKSTVTLQAEANTRIVGMGIWVQMHNKNYLANCYAYIHRIVINHVDH